MSTSMALIPLMIRLAPALGMMDKPDPRKIHLAPIPRVGGVGIVVGALIPLLIWLPWNDLTLSYFLGSLVLLVFGLWDDARELGHYVKFAGQFVAALLVVYYGGLHVSVLPFGGMEPIGETWGQFFTVFAIVGMLAGVALNIELWLFFAKVSWLWWNLFSFVFAVGIGLAEIRHVASRALETPLDESVDALAAAFARLETEVGDELRAQGVAEGSARLIRRLAVRVAGSDTALVVDAGEPAYRERLAALREGLR